MVSGRATSDEHTEVTASSSALRLEQQVLAKGDVVGRYVVLSMLGAGGMGVVYAAYDPELDRKVALKLLHHDKAAPEGRRRLLREAQAMARLTHPAVVTVHDVGEHEGRVFIAMEYVDGVTMREWLRGRVRPWRDVLKIYVEAGRGLVAAHALGLVHRDFKPDNVMVTASSADPDAPIERVRVMDFGLARAFGPLTDRDPNREDADFRPRHDMLDSSVTLGIAGTPAYMAPEQKADADVDARADQFAFCVSVWEGVYGEKPFAMDNLAELAVAQLAGRIQIPRKRGIPPGIRRTLERGLAPDPSDRFDAMETLLAELQRDPSRRRALIGMASAVVLLGAGAAAWLVIDRERDEAACETEGAAIAEIWNDDARARVRASLTAGIPEQGAATADRVVPQLDEYASAWQAARTDACTAATIEHSMDPTIASAARSCLDERFARLEGLVDVLADANADDVWRASQSASELPTISRCSDEAWLRVRPPLPDDPGAREAVERVRRQLQRGQPLRSTRPDDATKWQAETLEAAEAVGWQPLLAEALLGYGTAVNAAGRHTEAEAILIDAYLNALAAGDDVTAAETAAMLTAVVGYHLGRHEEGLVWGRVGETLAHRQGSDDRHLEARLLSATGLVLVEAGDFEAALDHHTRARDLWAELFGPEHMTVAGELGNLGMAQWRMGRYGEAKETFERGLAMWESAVGPQHPEVALLLNNLGSVEYERGNLDEAESLFERALKMRAATVGVRHATYGTTLSNLGGVAQARNKPDEALEYFEEAMEVFRAKLGERHPRVAMLHTNIGNVHLGRDDYDQAEKHYRRAVDLIEETLGPDHGTLALPLANLGVVNEARGEYGKAKAQLERSLALFERSVGSDHPQVARPLATLGDIALDEERYGDAAELLERALAIYDRAEVSGTTVANVQVRLAAALQGLGRDPERVRSLAKAAREGADASAIPRIEALLAELDADADR